MAGGEAGDSEADSGAGAGESSAAAEGGVDVLRVEAGWSAILRLPQVVGEGDLAEMLLREVGVVVHPGSVLRDRRGRPGGGEFIGADGGVCERDSEDREGY